MPRKGQTQNNDRFSQFKSVYLDFSDRERDQIVKWGADRSNDLSDLMEQYTTDGWKISLSYSAGWSAYVCSITPKDVSDYEGNRVFIFRNANYSRIVGFLCYFFGEMVPNSDARLRGEVSDIDW